MKNKKIKTQNGNQSELPQNMIEKLLQQMEQQKQLIEQKDKQLAAKQKTKKQKPKKEASIQKQIEETIEQAKQQIEEEKYENIRTLPRPNNLPNLTEEEQALEGGAESAKITRTAEQKGSTNTVNSAETIYQQKNSTSFEISWWNQIFGVNENFLHQI